MTVLDVPITNLTQKAAVALIRRWVAARDECSRSVFIANAHTLNLASEHPWYRDILRRADVVFGDGTGVRLAARLRGVRMCANLVGTDLVPRLMAESLSDGVRYYLLGAGADTVGRAVRSLEERIPGIAIAGFHHGFVDGAASREVVERINAARPGVLLVAMGNPLQEEWITRHLPDLRVPVSIGVGGLFDHWAGNLVRAPHWIRRAGFEWLQILLQQPRKKWRRYMLGNPKFIARALAAARTERIAPPVAASTGFSR
ncbi:MAG TPA: WecB/TagA/CpsF family glycosyltransferase [Candidatus Binatia bacterium]|nr:WecB/TagA/CpsF family glycosyltransferase [Candidatus Binatia bacterium]